MFIDSYHVFECFVETFFLNQVLFFFDRTSRLLIEENITDLLNVHVKKNIVVIFALIRNPFWPHNIPVDRDDCKHAKTFPPCVSSVRLLWYKFPARILSIRLRCRGVIMILFSLVPTQDKFFFAIFAPVDLPRMTSMNQPILRSSQSIHLSPSQNGKRCLCLFLTAC